jgi:hypothetical protein
MKKEKTTVCPNCETDKFLFISPFTDNEFINCGSCGCELDENDLIILTKQKG